MNDDPVAFLMVLIAVFGGVLAALCAAAQGALWLLVPALVLFWGAWDIGTFRP